MNDKSDAESVVDKLNEMQGTINELVEERNALSSTINPPPPPPPTRKVSATGYFEAHGPDEDQPVLKGKRTIITGWITALAPVLAIIGIDYDPDAVINFLKEFDQLLIIAFTALGAAIHKFREKA